MFDVPLNTHRRKIEPLSECNHVKKVLVKRFIGFLDQIEKCSKVVVSQLLIHVKQDVRSTTGSNSKKIMLLSGKTRVEEVDQSDATKLKYHQQNDDEEWKVVTNKELIDVKYGRKELKNLNYNAPLEVYWMSSFFPSFLRIPRGARAPWSMKIYGATIHCR